MQKITPALFAIAVIALAACGGGSDSTNSAGSDVSLAPVAEVTTDSSSSDGAPGLTAEEIDDEDMTVLGSYDIDGDELRDGIDGPPPLKSRTPSRSTPI